MLDETEDGTLLDGEDDFVNKLARAMNREHGKSNKTFQHFTQFCGVYWKYVVVALVAIKDQMCFT